jgi:hypothetical protein
VTFCAWARGCQDAGQHLGPHIGGKDVPLGANALSQKSRPAPASGPDIGHDASDIDVQKLRDLPELRLGVRL